MGAISRVRPLKHHYAATYQIKGGRVRGGREPPHLSHFSSPPVSTHHYLRMSVTVECASAPVPIPSPVTIAVNGNGCTGAKPSEPRDPLLEASYSSITQEERDFVKAQTGIEDDEALREHVLSVQAEAFNVHPYPCIRRFAFIK